MGLVPYVVAAPLSVGIVHAFSVKETAVRLVIGIACGVSVGLVWLRLRGRL